MNEKEKIIEILKNSNKELKSNEIASLSGIDKNHVDKIIKELVKEGIVFSPKRCYYQLK